MGFEGPNNSGHPPSVEDVDHCIQVLQSLLADRMLMRNMDGERRLELVIAAGKLSRPDRLEITKLSKRHRRIKHREEKQQDRNARATTGIRAARQSAVFLPPARTEGESVGELRDPRNCYVCKAEFRQMHFFYDAMCPSCATFNYQKRFQTASLDGKVAYITGARLKIGYQAALMMLRAGARVIVSTRFPHDAAQRFSNEEDFDVWGSRLQIHGLDLRHAPSVELFCEYLDRTLDRLDILINNAAQTVRRPPGFYRHLLELESKSPQELPAKMRSVLSDREQFLSQFEGARSAIIKPGSTALTGNLLGAGGPAMGILASAALSQLPYAFENTEEQTEYFPEGWRDADLQQVDLRGVNSWRLKLADVPAAEMIEVQLVNSVAPFILCARLKNLMLRTPNRDKHVVNVSAMEGKFTRYTKTDKHPHTNMAKAALNMMTVTSAPDYAKDGIFMNAVDTGWVTDEDPAALSVRKQQEHDFQPPLDIVDGAARVCDPFFSGLLTGEHVYGKFLKDYLPTTW